MSKHTPGPWRVGTWMDHADGHHPDGLTRGQFQIFPIPSDDEAEMYARMISRAPEMLELMTWIVGCLPPGETQEWTPEVQRETFEFIHRLRQTVGVRHRLRQAVHAATQEEVSDE